MTALWIQGASAATHLGDGLCYRNLEEMSGRSPRNKERRIGEWEEERMGYVTRPSQWCART